MARLPLIFMSGFTSECTPSYFNNEGDKAPKWALFNGYGHGWSAFEALLENWRNAGDMQGMTLS